MSSLQACGGLWKGLNKIEDRTQTKFYVIQVRRSSQPVEGLQKADASVLQRTKTALDEEESDKLVRYTASLKAWASIQATIKELQDTHPAKLSQIQVKFENKNEIEDTNTNFTRCWAQELMIGRVIRIIRKHVKKSSPPTG